MIAKRLLLAVLFGIAALSPAPGQQGLLEPREYLGMCDASAAVAVNNDLFVVASDEDSILRIYRHDRAGKPVHSFDMNRFLEVDKDHPETDIEGATRIGDRVFWITSHGANSSGKVRPSRRRLFATDLKIKGDTIDLVGAGKPYKNLVEDLAREPKLQRYHLEAAAKKAPKTEGALNIEGLTATPQGTLLLGFRNPIPQGKALVVPLENPNDVIEGKPARLGEPVELDLGGLGIRSIEYWSVRRNYLIVAGPYTAGGPFRLYQWSGNSREAPVVVKGIDFGNLTPEALIIYPDPNLKKVQILSDDGTRQLEGKNCKELNDENKMRFRSVWVTP